MIDTNQDNEIYIDTPTNYGHRSGSKFSHMFCKDISKLHKFAQSLGIKKCWYENKKGMNRPHYDVKECYYESAVLAGAIPVGLVEGVNKMQELFPAEWYSNMTQQKLI